GDVYWPASNSPPNLTVAGGGGITMNTARTVSGFFQMLSGNVTNGGQLTLNGTLFLSGGSLIGGPNYGSSSTLRYATGGTRPRGDEWSATSGPGYPPNVQITSTTLDLGTSGTGTARQCAGNLTIDAGATLTMNNGGNEMTAALTVLGNVTN